MAEVKRKRASVIVKVTREQHRMLKKESRMSGVTISNIVRLRVFPRVCPCKSDIEDPGPHIASCPYSDINYEPPNPAPIKETTP